MTAPRTELGAMLAAVQDVGARDDELLGVGCDLLDFFAGWSVDELDVLGWVAERLNKGREEYGSLDLEADARDWVLEAHEEATDLVAYAAIAAIKAMGRVLAPALTGDEEEGEVAVHSCVAAIRKDRSARDVGRREPGDEWECVCGQVFVVDTSGGWAKRVATESVGVPSSQFPEASEASAPEEVCPFCGGTGEIFVDGKLREEACWACPEGIEKNAARMAAKGRTS